MNMYVCNSNMYVCSSTLVRNTLPSDHSPLCATDDGDGAQVVPAVHSVAAPLRKPWSFIWPFSCEGTWIMSPNPLNHLANTTIVASNALQLSREILSFL